MSIRTPTLRELRARRPSNVEILPTAAPRKVQQRHNQQARRAKRDLRESQGQSFPYRHPHLRAEEPYARAMRKHGRSSEMLLSLMILQEFPKEDRRRIIDRLAEMQETVGGLEAYSFARLTDMTIGQSTALRAEMERQQ
ncbi:hypothetical protein I5L01_09310 [Erythrobacter sp. YJ-T3-07]|uniref:hypothetical protein n=1 Tax=Erythrobacter sp. YJ-T3-07 TaxID=2793063 RepID=UPI0018D38DEB|nr:hypothetical protein [Erythrobacter sp. YJ-T3-07]MBH1944430.1 hypothetical protein [Erythrobacter sp. YJ-T3-07]